MYAKALVQIIEDGKEPIVLFPPGFELDSAEVVLERVDGAVVLNPVPRQLVGPAGPDQ